MAGRGSLVSASLSIDSGSVHGSNNIVPIASSFGSIARLRSKLLYLSYHVFQPIVETISAEMR